MSITDEFNNQEAIGAIHSSWTLHKTGLLELELEDKAILVYNDEVAREYILRNVKNFDRMQTTHATIHALSNNCRIK